MTSIFASIWNHQPPFLTALHVRECLQWSVFPLDEDKRPPQIGGTYDDGIPKRLAWKQFQTSRVSLKELQLWQKMYNPSAWVVITGTISGLVDLDFDGEVGKETCR